jgi:hypothetical protein
MLVYIKPEASKRKYYIGRFRLQAQRYPAGFQAINLKLVILKLSKLSA